MSVISDAINPPVQLSIVVIVMFFSISFFVKKIYSERIFSLSTIVCKTLCFFVLCSVFQAVHLFIYRHTATSFCRQKYCLLP